MDKLHVNAKLLIVFDGSLAKNNSESLDKNINETLKNSTMYLINSGSLSTGLAAVPVAVEDFYFYTNVLGPDDNGDLYCHISLDIAFSGQEFNQDTVNTLCSNAKNTLSELAELTYVSNELDDGRKLFVNYWEISDSETFDPEDRVFYEAPEVALPQRDPCDPCF